ncbi:MAG TPA: GTPase Era [bacterium]
MKAGYIALVGEPNVGKSTLFNYLLKNKLSAVSPKPQTTRNRILGILVREQCQLCFFDTPGIITPDYPLQENMIHQLQQAIQDADIVVWITDPWFRSVRFPENLAKVARTKPFIAVVNKIDLADEPRVKRALSEIASSGISDAIALSALTGTGVEGLLSKLCDLLPENPFLYPEDDISDSPVRFFVAEIIREKIFQKFKEEIPYSTCVQIEEYKEHEEGKDLIRAVIYVERESQKGILIGKKGIALKRIGEAARKDIEVLIDHPVYLELWVKVKEQWRKDKKFLKEIGY